MRRIASACTAVSEYESATPRSRWKSPNPSSPKAARIIAAEPFDPAQITVALHLGTAGDGARILSRITRKSWDQLRLAPGDTVFAQIKGIALVRRRH